MVDFGLATELTVDKYIFLEIRYEFPKCGTPGYVAPEVLNLMDKTAKYGTPCDIFSVGCIFYKLFQFIIILDLQDNNYFLAYSSRKY